VVSARPGSPFPNARAVEEVAAGKWYFILLRTNALLHAYAARWPFRDFLDDGLPLCEIDVPLGDGLNQGIFDVELV
tara:strand:+ start:3044 stop:3271 length:228 start_codon:yes stop_codon:yes gene_type:complete